MTYIFVNGLVDLFECRRVEAQDHEDNVVEVFSEEHAEVDVDCVSVVSEVGVEEVLLAEGVEAADDQEDDGADVDLRVQD